MDLCVPEPSLRLFTSRQPQQTAALPQAATGGPTWGEQQAGKGA